MKNEFISEQPKMRVLLVDDQVLFLESLKLVIESIANDIEICGTAVNGEEAVSKTHSLLPDLILMDLRMPVMDGVTAVKFIHSEFPNIKIIVLTTFDDDADVVKAMQYGAAGYLLKNIAPPMLVSAVRAVHAGNILIDPNIAGTLIQNMFSSKNGENLVGGERLPDWYYDLSVREKTIIKHLLMGKTNNEIASDINIGGQTIRNYISTIYSKLEVPDRRSLIQKVREIPSMYFS